MRVGHAADRDRPRRAIFVGAQACYTLTRIGQNRKRYDLWRVDGMRKACDNHWLDGGECASGWDREMEMA